MSSGFTIEAIHQRKDPLFQLICCFNADPAGYVHPSFLGDQVPYPVLSIINRSERTRKRLNHFLSKHLKVQNDHFTNFENPRLRLALLDSDTLHNLTLYAGIVYYASNIKQIVQKEALTQLKESIGDEAYFFALKKTPLYSTAKPRITNLNANPADLYHGMLTAGQRMLELLLSGMPNSLTARLTLKFPKNRSWNFKRTVSPELQDDIWNFLHRLLTKEVNPDSSVCFT